MKNFCLLILAISFCFSSYAQYVDLGLPSGTKWKSVNEAGDKNGFYTYDEAIKAFGNKLPTKKQCKELIDKCKLEWQKDEKTYKVTGANGNFIILPAAGYRDCGGDVDGVGSYGHYWSSTPGDLVTAWSLYFNSGGVYESPNDRCSGQPVRLVQD